jgi:pimeloyl-ACP methyl ester carboxylesterase
MGATSAARYAGVAYYHGMLREMTLPGGVSAFAADLPGDVRPPLLLIHGMFGGGWQFAEWQTRLLRRGRSTVAIDLRAGDATDPSRNLGSASLSHYVDVARRAARHLECPAAVGHSMGGLIVQKLAEEGAVSAAVLLCSAPPRWITALSGGLLARMAKYTPELLGSRALVPLRSDADALFLERVPLAERDDVFARLRPESGRAARQLALGAVAVDAARVKCPVLSIGAAEDRFLPPRIARAIARKYRGYYREYKGHGHYIVGEPGWERVADDVAGWLAAHE